MTRYAVFGQPIAHSLSPRIHALFGEQLGIAVDYRAIEAGRDAFASALAAFARAGGAGANVTLPLKQDAAALCVSLSARARRCGSVNTLVREGDGWHGDSTDGSGFLRDLVERVRFDPRGSRVLLLGAGGAARAVAFALADAGAGELTIANRTHRRAEALASGLAADAPLPSAAGARPAQACAWDDLYRLAARGAAFDLVVNATAAGHAGAAFAALPALAANAICHDLSYGAAARPFLDWARRAGAGQVRDGLGMLVEQAAESFALWHGRRPETGDVLACLREVAP
jgi:shikimate dehydrogenase